MKTSRMLIFMLLILLTMAVSAQEPTETITNRGVTVSYPRWLDLQVEYIFSNTILLGAEDNQFGIFILSSDDVLLVGNFGLGSTAASLLDRPSSFFMTQLEIVGTITPITLPNGNGYVAEALDGVMSPIHIITVDTPGGLVVGIATGTLRNFREIALDIVGSVVLGSATEDGSPGASSNENVTTQASPTHGIDLVSKTSTGRAGSGHSPSMSSDGRFVAFTSITSLDPPKSDGCAISDCNDVYIHDRLTGITEIISTSSQGSYSGSFDPQISDDGRYVVFVSADNLLVPAPGTPNYASLGSPIRQRPNYDVYIHDRTTKITRRISRQSDSSLAGGDSYNPEISRNGNFVVFTSNSIDLLPNELRQRCDEGRALYYSDPSRVNCYSNVFLYDIKLDQVTGPISKSHNGLPSNGHSDNPVISANGRFIAYVSFAGNIDPDQSPTQCELSDQRESLYEGQGLIDTSGTDVCRAVYLYDSKTSTTKLISKGLHGEAGNGGFYSVDMSDDGRLITFISNSSNLEGEAPPTCADPLASTCFIVFVYESTSETIRSLPELSYDHRGIYLSITGNGQFLLLLDTHIDFENENYPTTGYETRIYDISSEKIYEVDFEALGIEANTNFYYTSSRFDISPNGVYLAFRGSDMQVYIAPVASGIKEAPPPEYFANIPGVTIDQDDIPVHILPSNDSELIGETLQGERYFVIAENEAGDWLYIKYKHLYGWIFRSSAVIGNDLLFVIPTIRQIQLTDKINIRSGPSAGYGVLATDSSEDIVTVTGRNAASTWLQIEYGDRLAWICAERVSKSSVNVLTLDIVDLSAFSCTEPHEAVYLYDGMRVGPEDAANIIFVNGIQNTYESLQHSITRVSEVIFDNQPVMAVYNESAGSFIRLFDYSVLAIIDIVQAMGDINASLPHIPWLFPSYSNPAVTSLSQLIREKNGEVILVGHSQGAAIISTALQLLEAESFPLENITVLSLGGAGVNFPEGPRYTFCVNEGDPVPTIAQKWAILIGARVALLKDLFELAKMASNSNMNQHHLDAYLDAYEKGTCTFD